LNPFLRAQKKPWSAFRAFCFLLFAFRVRARKQANAHVHFERERERAENENQKKEKKDKFSQTSERLRERTLPRCRDLSLDKVVRRRLKAILKAIDQSINRSIDKIENSVLPQCFSRSLRRRRRRLLSLRPAGRSDSDGHLPAETKKNQQFKK
jgi:hypothetical protein